MEYNQTLKADKGKLPLTKVPLEAIEDIAEVRAYGIEKYGSEESWREVEIERYRDALFRHLVAYLRDPQGKDEESGLEHYKHLATNAAFICALERRAKESIMILKGTPALEEIKEALSDAWKNFEPRITLMKVEENEKDV